jgi:hypothetical protein
MLYKVLEHIRSLVSVCACAYVGGETPRTNSSWVLKDDYIHQCFTKLHEILVLGKEIPLIVGSKRCA